MTLLVAGVDLSTRSLDVALIPIEADHGDVELPAAVFRRDEIPKTRDPSQRCRSVARLLPDLLRAYDTLRCHWTVGYVVVEEPFGRFRSGDRALLPIYGAVLGAVPRTVAATGIHVQEWRRELGLAGNLSKAGAVDAAVSWIAAERRHVPPNVARLDDHQAEALLIALAGRHRNQRATAA